MNFGECTLLFLLYTCKTLKISYIIHTFPQKQRLFLNYRVSCQHDTPGSRKCSTLQRRTRIERNGLHGQNRTLHHRRRAKRD